MGLLNTVVIWSETKDCCWAALPNSAAIRQPGISEQYVTRIDCAAAHPLFVAFAVREDCGDL